jgi:hypothetical protein
LYYRLEINNNTIKSWNKDLPGMSSKLDLQQIPHVGSTGNIAQRQVFTVFLKGKIQDMGNLISALKISWITAAPSESILVLLSIKINLL